MDVDALLSTVADAAQEREPGVGGPRLAHVYRREAQPARLVDLPDDLPPAVRARLEVLGVSRLYAHQAEAVALVRAGCHTVVATGTASGKSLCYQLPIAERAVTDGHATALYLAPTKALARDQLAALRSWRLPHLRVAAIDGDTPARERDAIRRSANVLLSNPDMLHASLLPSHRRFADFFHRLQIVVLDECHVARGILGAHVAAVLRRLRRVCAHYGAAPTFVLASATIGNPAEHAAALTGLAVRAVTDDASARPPLVLGLWEPPLLDARAGVRRSALTESAELLADLAARDVVTLDFVRSRKGAEVVARQASRLADGAAVRAYRAGHLPAERRAVERGLADGTLRGVATTNALELGIDVGDLDAVVVTGWPGTATSLWQQAGRAGRRGTDALVVFVADDDPLDHYLLAHPDHLVDRPVESAVLDLGNPAVLRPHLRCAAAELPLETGDEAVLSPGRGSLPDGWLADVLDAEERDGTLRRRGDRWYWAGRGSAAARVSLRGGGGRTVAIVEQDTGVLIGEVDEPRAHATVHDGAVYLHQGTSWRVQRLDLRDAVALVDRDDGPEYTRARADTDLAVLAVERTEPWGPATLAVGRVAVSRRVVAYERRRVGDDRSLGLVALDLPPVHLRTRAFWVTLPLPVLEAAGLGPAAVPGAAHAAEHAAIGLLPLFAMCDRWDIGGLSTDRHPDTGTATIFVYDGHEGGAGIAERGFDQGRSLFAATADAVHRCACADGCPSCIQSPKCGNGNHPLDKAGAVRLLTAVLAHAPHGAQG